MTSRLRSVLATWAGGERAAETNGLVARVETALAGPVGRRLGLSTYRLRHGHCLHAIGDGEAGRLFLTFVPRSERGWVARIVASQQLLAVAGIDTPELVDADVEAREDPALAWVAVRWHEGAPASRRDAATSRKALAQLARIHAIERDVQAAAGRADLTEALPRFYDLDALANELESLRRRFADAGVELPRGEFARVQRFLQSRIDAMRRFDPAPPIVLLHTDYQPRNLRITPDGRLLVLDLEGSCFGAFPIDLARALFKFRYRSAGRQLDAGGLGDVLDDPALADLQHAYLAAAPENIRKFWTAHGRTVLVFGYLGMVRRRVKAACNTRRYGARKRQKSLRQALGRWRRVVRFVERSG
ncbi:MAG: aminoglycoside phosphotransferase family protein [Myxococcota bacterium]|nr:aminoglycoside phosphotransferase family protein [Myxococcota bacterium]